jgi:hypothetical protein
MRVGKPNGILGYPVYMEGCTKMDIKEIDRGQWRAPVNMLMDLWFP